MAGSLTGVVLIVLLAFGLPASSLGQQEVQVDTATSISVENSDSAELVTLQQTNAELEAALRLMQERETAYQRELEAANEAILDMQEAAQQSAYEESDVGSYEEYEDDYEEHEEDDDEYEEEDDDDD